MSKSPMVNLLVVCMGDATVTIPVVAPPIVILPVPFIIVTDITYDGYVRWASTSAKASVTFFIDLNAFAADRYDALGQEKAAAYFNDFQHTKKIGARLNAECVVEGLKQLKNCPLAEDLAVTPAAAPPFREGLTPVVAEPS